MKRRIHHVLVLAALIPLTVLTGCQTEPQYAKPLPAGAFALRKITDPAQMPSLTPIARQMDDPSFKQALTRSLHWFSIKSTKAYFPVGSITHKQAWMSLYAISQLDRGTTTQRVAAIKHNFDVWQSVGWDNKGSVFFTGYYSPIFDASKTRQGPYQYPLYKRPADLVTDPATGHVLGRRTPRGIVPYPTRSQIKQTHLLAGQELVYLKSKLDAYIVEVNGSAKLRLTDGSVMYIGYAGSNGRPYKSLGKMLAQSGKVDKNRMTLQTIEHFFHAHPDQLESYIQQNPRFIFFKPYSAADWPAGSLGFQVTPMRTLATDKSIFPRGCLVLVQTWMPDSASTNSGRHPFYQAMFDQDTGGAIRAAGRADIYIGVGAQARMLAGRVAGPGRLFYLLLKPQMVDVWWNRMAAAHQTND